MTTEICSVCRYELTGLSADAACPECGAGAKARGAALRGRDLLLVLMGVNLVLVFPCAAFVGLLSFGWLYAHLVVNIPNPHGVQDGVYPFLDALSVIVFLFALPAPLSFLAVPTLALAGVLAWRGASTRAARLQFTILLAALTLPLAVKATMFIQPFEGILLRLMDWIPD